MRSSGFPRRRVRPVAVELLEGRALLSTISPGTPSAVPATHAGSSPIQIQPMRIQEVPVKLTARPPSSPGAKAGATDALHVGAQYTKLVFSSATRKVGWSYVKAAFHGDSHKLENLSKTRPVVALGQNFKAVGHSSQAQSVGQSFHNFGHSISHQFHRIFK